MDIGMITQDEEFLELLKELTNVILKTPRDKLLNSLRFLVAYHDVLAFCHLNGYGLNLSIPPANTQESLKIDLTVVEEFQGIQTESGALIKILNIPLCPN